MSLGTPVDRCAAKAQSVPVIPVADDDEAAVCLAGRTAFGAAFDTAEAYAALLVGRATEWGLLGPREGGRVWSRHLLNSAALASAIGPALAVADVGSGAGLPGIPLALARPDLRVTLIESLGRRARFLRLAVDELGLADRVDVVHQRAERVNRTFDAVVSRAVAPLPVLIPWCLPLTRASGHVLAMRGGHVDQEVAEYVARFPRMRSRTAIASIPSPGSDEAVRVVRVAA